MHQNSDFHPFWKPAERPERALSARSAEERARRSAQLTKMSIPTLLHGDLGQVAAASRAKHGEGLPNTQYRSV
jgi:hypothetical protein